MCKLCCNSGGGYEFVSTEEWEEEQKRVDRQWYSLDEGYDESHNPFSGLSDEYTKRKEQELEQKRKKKISARTRQIQKVTLLIIFIVFYVFCLLASFVDQNDYLL